MNMMNDKHEYYEWYNAMIISYFDNWYSIVFIKQLKEKAIFIWVSLGRRTNLYGQATIVLPEWARVGRRLPAVVSIM